MNIPSEVQVIKRLDGTPAFAVIPWANYLKYYPQDHLIPNEVVGYMVKEGFAAIAAWRKYLGLSQATVAQRIGISQSAYAQQEAAIKPRQITREKIAEALDIAPELLDI